MAKKKGIDHSSSVSHAQAERPCKCQDRGETNCPDWPRSEHINLRGPAASPTGSHRSSRPRSAESFPRAVVTDRCAPRTHHEGSRPQRRAFPGDQGGFKNQNEQN